MSRYLIYVLLDPRFDLADPKARRYVGKSASGLSRARSHSRPSSLQKDQRSNWQKYAWLQELKSLGLSYGIEVLREVSEEGALPIAYRLGLAEREEIAHARSNGWNILNRTDGGENVVSPMKGRSVSAETRAKIAAANVGRRMSADAVARSVASRLSTRTGEELTRAAVAASAIARIGSRRSPETKQRISAGLIGRPVSAKTRAKIGARHRGKIVSSATRTLISTLAKARPAPSPESIEKTAAFNRGRKRDPEIARRAWATRRAAK